MLSKHALRLCSHYPVTQLGGVWEEELKNAGPDPRLSPWMSFLTFEYNDRLQSQNQMARKAEFKVLPETSGREKWPNSKWTEVLNRIITEEGVRMSPNYCQVPLPPHTASPVGPSVFISQAGNTGKGEERRGQMRWGRWASTTGGVCMLGQGCSLGTCD